MECSQSVYLGVPHAHMRDTMFGSTFVATASPPSTPLLRSNRHSPHPPAPIPRLRALALLRRRRSVCLAAARVAASEKPAHFRTHALQQEIAEALDVDGPGQA